MQGVKYWGTLPAYAHHGSGGFPMKTADYLDALKARLSLSSDYALAKRLDTSTAAVSNYRRGKRTFDALMAYRVAELLDLDPMRVLADMEAERATRPEVRQVWADIAARFKDAAIVAAMAVGGAMTLGALNITPIGNAHAGENSAKALTEYTLRNKRRRILGVAV